MSDVNPTLGEVLEASQRTLAARIHTSIPGQVVVYDPVTNTATIKAAVKDFVFDGDGDRTYDDAIVFSTVLVMWPRGGGHVVRLPLLPGDTVNLLFAERSIAEWRTSGQASEPLDSRRLSVGYPVAVPGLSPDTSPLSPEDAVEVAAGALVVGRDGGPDQMLVGGTVPGVRFGRLAVQPVALAAPIVAALAAVQAALAAIVAIPAVAGAAAAVGTSATAVTAAAAGSASTLVKAL